MYHCAIFTKVAKFIVSFRMRQLLKFRWNRSRGYGVMGVLRWGDGFLPNFQRPLAAKLCVETLPPKDFRGARTCSRSSIPSPCRSGITSTAVNNDMFSNPCSWPVPLKSSGKLLTEKNESTYIYSKVKYVAGGHTRRTVAFEFWNGRVGLLSKL